MEVEMCRWSVTSHDPGSKKEPCWPHWLMSGHVDLLATNLQSWSWKVMGTLDEGIEEDRRGIEKGDHGWTVVCRKTCFTVKQKHLHSIREPRALHPNPLFSAPLLCSPLLCPPLICSPLLHSGWSNFHRLDLVNGGTHHLHTVQDLLLVAC